MPDKDVSILDGEEPSSIFNSDLFSREETTYDQLESSIESTECQAQLLLMKTATKYMLIDWKHETFPRKLPDDLDQMMSVKDVSILEGILKTSEDL